MKRFVTVFTMVVLLLSGTFIMVAQEEQTDCTQVDLSGVSDLLSQSQTAFDNGDVATALQTRAEARRMLADIEARCLMTPIIEGLNLDEPVSAEDIAAMPACQYRFDATVRSGANAGTNVHGTLSLIQDSDTTATGYVIPDTTDTSPIPVEAQLGEGRTITLTFTLPEGATIVGTGTMDTTLAGCFGVMEGDFTGPGADDTGDWLAGAGNGGIERSGRVEVENEDRVAACVAANLPQCTTICRRSLDPNCTINCQGQVYAMCEARYGQIQQ